MARLAIMTEECPTEKRRHVRTDLLKGARVAWQGAAGRLVSRISNLSLGGLFIETPEPPAVGTIMKLLFEAPGREVRARAIVRRSVPGQGMGVEFVEMGNEDRARLRDLLKAGGASKSHGKAQTADRQHRKSRPATPHADPILLATMVENTKAHAATSSRIRVSERRAHRRHRVTALVEIEAESGEHAEAQLVNLGRAGCYVKTDSPVSVGTAISVCITKGAHSFQAQAKVVSAMPGKGMGLVFTTVEPEQFQTLDTWLEASLEPSWLAANRRRNQRLVLMVPVQVAGNNSLGTRFTEDTHTITISPHGALVLLSTVVSKGQRLTLSNPRTKAEVECAVVYLAQGRSGKNEVGVAFLLPNRAFWKVAFPPSDWSPRHSDAKRT